MSQPSTPVDVETYPTIQLQAVREALAKTPELKTAVSSLSHWVSLLWLPPFLDAPLDERLLAALSHPLNNPASWCKANGCVLPPAIAAEFEAGAVSRRPGRDLSSIATYLLGRAAMRHVLNDPVGSAGLSTPYDVLYQLERSGLAYLAADEELNVSFNDDLRARAEIESEATRLGCDPASAANEFERGGTEAAIRAANSIVTLDACSHPNIRSLPVDLPFGRVLQVIGRSDPAFVAALLEVISNPVIVAAILTQLSILDVPNLISLLAHLNCVFNEGNTWTRRSTAWVTLLEIESRLETHVQMEQISTLPAPTSWLNTVVNDIVSALDNRIDGPRLELEWLAHMTWQVANSTVSSLRLGWTAKMRPNPTQNILEAALKRLRSSSWASPVQVWELFGGSPVIPDARIGSWATINSSTELPCWLDRLGRATIIIPAMVAVSVSTNNQETVDWLFNWVRLVIKHFEGDSNLFLVSSNDLSAAAAQLAWPLVHLNDPAGAFEVIWKDAAWLRTRARFEEITQAADVVAPLDALIRVGLCALAWAPAASERDWRRFADLVADCVDESRYLVPEIGAANWSRVVGELVGTMALIGLLDGKALVALLSRYIGDDDALAEACVYASLNGISAEMLCKALTAIGEDAASLVRRWACWNKMIAYNKQGQPSRFLLALRKLAE